MNGERVVAEERLLTELKAESAASTRGPTARCMS